MLAPTTDLAIEIIAGLAEIAQTDGIDIDHVETRNRLIHRIVIGGSGVAADIGKGRVPDHPALDTIHDVEPGADDRIIRAQAKDAGDRKADRTKRLKHASLAVDRMRALQKLPRRLAPHDVIPARRHKPIGRV